MAQDENGKVDLEKADGAVPPPEPAAPKPKRTRKRKPKAVAAELPLEPVAPAPDDEVRYQSVDDEAAEEAAAVPTPVDAAPEPEAEAPAEDAARAHSATEEVTLTRPREAPLPDDTGLANAFSPVDLPEPEQPLRRPFFWMTNVIGVASLLLALFNAEAIRGWANELPAGPIAARIVEGSDQWYAFTDSLGLTAPTATMRGWWDAAQAARFGSAPPEGADGNEAAPAGATH